MIVTIKNIKAAFYQDENSSLLQRIFWNSLYIAFFFLPIDINIPTPFISVAIVCGCINIFKSEKKYDSKNRVLLLFPLYFVILVVSMIYTQNTSDGWHLIQRSLTLLLFPIILLFLKEDALSVRKLFNFLLYGLVISFFINLTIVIYDAFLIANSLPSNVSFWKSLAIGWKFFMHIQFSSLINPGYVSLYILLVLSYYLKNELNTIWRFLTVIILFAYLFLLASKAAYITLFFMSILLILKVADKSKKYLLILVLGLSTLIFISNPRIVNSINNFPDEIAEVNPTISWKERMLSWKAAIKTIEVAPLFGYGVGDAHDVLIEGYNDLGYTENYKHRYNAHNQFLETWLQTGLIGVFVLMVIFTNLALHTRRSFNEFSVFLALFLALIFESMLVRFNGIVFFSIVVPLLLKERTILSSRVIKN
ncbi:O-antigen ligase family protein [Galbibacter orientalis]|uniref:O-antigen ligase family protein n=1 Tax=Galbibacter orientalis TaxID=453852 RepID=UPI0030801D0A